MSLFDDDMLQEDDPVEVARRRSSALCGRANQALRDLGVLGYGDILFYPSDGGAVIFSRSTPERFEQFLQKMEERL